MGSRKHRHLWPLKVLQALAHGYTHATNSLCGAYCGKRVVTSVKHVLPINARKCPQGPPDHFGDTCRILVFFQKKKSSRKFSIIIQPRKLYFVI